MPQNISCFTKAGRELLHLRSRQSADPALARIPTLLLSQQVMMFIPAKKIVVDRRSAISDHHYGPAPYPGVHCNTEVL